MKKTILALTGCIFFALSCTKETESFKEDTIDESAAVETPVIGNRCAADEVLQQQLLEDPSLAGKMQAIENLTAQYLKNPGDYYTSGGNVIIPVVFNVLYKTAAENVSLAQLQSQIDVLNADFSAMNGDYNNTPTYFQGVRSGDIHIRFELAAVNRRATNKKSWSTNDAMKKASLGGINPTSPSTMMNFWVCNMGGGILGYAQFPGGNPATDGIVCDDNATGNTGTASAPYGLGRTATHEIGHYLNLRHIWGDATCGNDFVNDTPLHQSSNGGCPAFPKYGSCSATIPMQTMNYMDYTYDACMYMFTAGQAARMNATFLAGGGRSGLAQ